MVGTVEVLSDDSDVNVVEQPEAGGEPAAAPRRTYRDMYGTTVEDIVLYCLGVAAGCFCLYLGLYSPSLSLYRMQKMKPPAQIQWDDKSRRFIGWWAASGSLVVGGGVSILLCAIGIVVALYRLALGVIAAVRSTVSYMTGAVSKKKKED
eukprot:TRINITY_DN10441_c0_g2_i1.p1 TRINITY_DN10441_c0_g2~~TRINITY_DN10441_c0_g2_i1.p1  ORF type:complete len:165 (+),score=48.97 TRINITY_DN10441_c0_g2_i1:47-496(+)